MEKHINSSRNRNGLLLRSHHQTDIRSQLPTTSSDFVLQWGNRKRLRCMKVNNDSAGPAPVQRSTARVDHRVVRSGHNQKEPSTSNQPQPTVVNNSNGHLNLRQRPASPAQRILRNSDCGVAMKGQSNGVRGLCSQERGGGAQDKNSTKNPTSNNNGRNKNPNGGSGGGGSGSSETAHDSKKGGSSSGGDAIPTVWPPKFVIGLTNKEKEEDFLAIKGSKLPHRPKKRAKFIQRTLNLVSPGAWLCDLTLDRYEVMEKKVTKKRPRGLKAMGNMESDSE